VLGEAFKGRTQFDMRPLSVRANMARRSGYRAGRWTSVAISAQHVPTNVLSAVFSHADLRMWIVSEPVRGERHLIRLDRHRRDRRPARPQQPRVTTPGAAR
jgi:hypothetical protein